MAESLERTETSNRHRGSSGGGTAETYPASARATSLPPKGEDKAGDPFSAGTTQHQDDERQQVTTRQQGSGD